MKGRQLRHQKGYNTHEVGTNKLTAVDRPLYQTYTWDEQGKERFASLNHSTYELGEESLSPVRELRMDHGAPWCSNRRFGSPQSNVPLQARHTSSLRNSSLLESLKFADLQDVVLSELH